MQQILAMAILMLSTSITSCPVSAQTPQPCESEGDTQLRDAIVESRNFVALTWVERGPDWHTSFDSAAVARNPFASHKEQSGAVATHGQIWARDVSCGIVKRDGNAGAEISYSAASYRFNEDGRGWSKPLKNGVLIVFELALKEDRWTVNGTKADRSVLLPDIVLRRPKPEELPNPKAWLDKRRFHGQNAF